MIKTLNILLKQDKERFVVPKGVQDVIPVKAIYDDGIFQVGRDKFTRSFKFTDINYAVASREDKEAMFLEYSELLNSLDSGATTKITINNRRLNRLDFEKTILMPLKGDALDEYREEYNKMLLERATGANAYAGEVYHHLREQEECGGSKKLFCPCGRRPDRPLRQAWQQVRGDGNRRTPPHFP